MSELTAKEPAFKSSAPTTKRSTWARDYVVRGKYYPDTAFGIRRNSVPLLDSRFADSWHAKWIDEARLIEWETEDV